MTRADRVGWVIVGMAAGVGCMVIAAVVFATLDELAQKRKSRRLGVPR